MLGIWLLFLADVTQHVRMDVETDIGHVVKMLAGDEPNDLADLAFGIMRDMRAKVSRLTFLSCVSSVTSTIAFRLSPRFMATLLGCLASLP